MKKLLIPAMLFVLIGAGCEQASTVPVTHDAPQEEVSTDTSNTSEVKAVLAPPLSRMEDRTYLLTFGKYITPETTPIVPPESFTGYHAGLDVEIFEDELNADVLVSAVCDGPVVFAGTINGYGGLLIESCEIGTEAVTILYGHLDVKSVALKKGDVLSSGERIGILGDDHSSETSGNRKHLHFGIHKGTIIDYKGFVQNEAGLDAYLDPAPLLGL